MESIALRSLVEFLDRLLDTANFEDASLNGLQIDSGKSEVRTAAFAVDSGESVLNAALEQGADVLIVHHGMLWGGQDRLTGAFGRKVAACVQGGLSLYASHLPLDAHLEVGNAAELARFLGLDHIRPEFAYQGKPIGVTASCAPRSIEEFIELGSRIPGFRSHELYAHGPARIQTVGVATGSGSFAMPRCAELGLDLLISGESKHEVFHLAQELGINSLFLGHYATETFGVLALKGRIEQEFGIRGVFIDIPSGI